MTNRLDPSRRFRSARWALAGTTAIYTITIFAVPRDASGFNVLLDGVLSQIVLFGAAALLVARTLTWSQDRGAWAALAVGVTAWAFGDLYWVVKLRLVDDLGPSIADVLYLALYPTGYVALLLFARSRVRFFHTSMWLDGLIALLGAAAVGAVALQPVLELTGGSAVVVLTNLSYPLGDLLLLSGVVAVLALARWRTIRSLVPVALGLVLFSVADTSYLLQAAKGTYQSGTVIDPLWNGGLVVMALGSWSQVRDAEPLRLDGLRSLAVPLVAILGALAVLIYHQVTGAGGVAGIFAVATIAVGVGRTALSFREVWRLQESRLQARTDDLTGLANRRLLREQAEVLLQDRTDGLDVALLVIDLDRFKEVNDALGHSVGDELLRQLGPRLRAALREADVVARLGGDEFAILVEIGEGEAEVVARRALDAIVAPFTVGEVDLHVDASVGIALFPEHARDFAGLLQRADIAMYQAKATTLPVAMYSADRDGHTRERLELIEALRRGIAAGELVLYYQPQVDLASGEVRGVEALLRWQHPSLGLIPPNEFIPLAEQTNLIGVLTMHVLQLAIDQSGRWREDGLELPIAVNLSGANLMDDALPEKVAGLLGRAGLPASALSLEITETTLMADPLRSMAVIARLRELGLSLAVDDYGTGYSSLAYLRDLPVQELKLDQSFVFDLTSDAAATAIVESTVRLAHSLGLRMVAEGVETVEALELLRRFGCDTAQGYLLSRPVPASDLEAWLRSYRGLPGSVAATAAALAVHR